MRQLLACLIVLTACKGDRASTSSSSPSPSPPSPAPAAAHAPAAPVTPDSGFCTLEASGAFSGSGTTPGDNGSFASKYWSKGAPAGVPAVALLLNCHATTDVHLTIAALPTADVPFGPKTYTVLPTGGDIAISGRAGSGILHMAGTFAITAWDNKHIAGTVDVSGKRIKGNDDVRITGTFDLPCHTCD